MNVELQAALEEIVRMYPTKVWVPNVAQRRILAPWARPPYPMMVVATCGNGTGKTDVIPQDIVGCLCGPEYLNKVWNRDENGKAVGMTEYRFYHECKELRESGTFQYRLLCGPEDMKENGSLYSAIKRYIPTAEFKGKTSTNSYKQIEIPLPSKPKVRNFIDIKTFDQEPVAHSGANLHRIAINEPPPFSVFAETMSRTRSKKGSVQCRILLNATILDQATWIFDLENDDYYRGRVVFVQGSIWENCVGEEVTDDVAERLFEKIGTRLKKDPATGHYLTYGVLTSESINNQIHFFERTDPNQIESRIWGSNTQTFGSEFKSFNINVHRVSKRVVPRGAPVIQVVDPHPVKNDLCGYAWIDQLLRLHWFEEWPHCPWEKVSARTKTIREICAEWAALEDQWGVAGQIACRVGDPNRFQTADSRDNLPLWALYSAEGFSFNLFINDSLEYGHQCIHDKLWYDKRVHADDPADIIAQPSMDFSENCENLINGMKFYGRKARRDPLAAPSESMDKTWKDPADIVRYGCVYVKGKSFNEIRDASTGDSDDYRAVRESRGDIEPSDHIPSYKLKGRTLLKTIERDNYDGF